MNIIMTTTQLTLLLLGLALLCLALLCILYKWFTNREAEDKERPGTHLEEVLVDGGRGDVPGSQPIFTVTSSYNEILSEDREELNEITPVHDKISEGVEETEGVEAAEGIDDDLGAGSDSLLLIL